MKDAIRPIYSELQGILSQAPDSKDRNTIYEPQVWEYYHGVVTRLATITGDTDLKRFELRVTHGQGSAWVNTTDFRSKTAGLVAHLHGEYFADEPAPFAGMPHVVVQQSQQQHQDMRVQLVMDVTERIVAEMPKHQEGTPQRNFLEKVKAGLASVKDAAALTGLVLKTAKDVGLALENLPQIFW